VEGAMMDAEHIYVNNLSLNEVYSERDVGIQIMGCRVVNEAGFD
jgi:hypothetical protein